MKNQPIPPALAKRADKWRAAGVQAATLQAVCDFAAARRAAGLARRSVEVYAWEVGQLALTYPALAPADYQAQHLAAYLEARRARMAPASYKLSVIALRVFFEWLRGAGSPAAGLDVPGKVVGVRPRRSLSRQQCDNLLAGFDTSTPAGARDVALMALMLDTAFRAAEVTALTVSGVDMETRRATVICKGGTLGRGKFSESTRALLLRWLDYRQRLAPPTVEALFVSVYVGRGLTVSGLTKICHRAAMRAGLPALAPHDLRRTFAHEVLRSGAPERIALEGGRWRSLRVFHEHYTRDISVDDVDAYLPTRRLGGGL